MDWGDSEKTLTIKKLKKQRMKAFNAGEDISSFDIQIAQLRKEIAVKIEAQFEAEKRVRNQSETGYSGEPELPISVVLQRVLAAYKKGREEGQEDLSLVTDLKIKQLEGRLGEYKIQPKLRGHIRRKGQTSWQINFYTGEWKDGKRCRYSETVRGNRLDAEKRLAELNSEGFHYPRPTTKKLLQQLNESGRLITKLAEENANLLCAGRSNR